MARMVLDGEWRDSTIESIGEAAVAALEDVEGDRALTQKIWRASSLATEFANLLCNRPALSAVPVESWTVPHYQRLFNDVSTIEREFRLLGDLDSKAHPACLAFHFLSQRLQDLLYVATNPLPNATSNTTPEAANESSWPVGNGWEFRPGQAAFQGEPFAITGKPAVILQRLAEKPGEPVLKRILWGIIDPDSDAQETCVSDNIAEARALLRTAFKLGSKVDPIPNLARGADAAWKLDENVF